MRFLLLTYGCTLNAHDSELMRELLLKAGHEEVQDEHFADVVIINTCGVKDATEKHMVHLIKSAKKPLVVGGCIATASPEMVRKFAPESVLVGTRSVGDICKAVQDAIALRKSDYLRGLDKGSLDYKFRPPIATVAVSDGCTGACTYCFTKLARPGLKSMRTGEILRRVRIAEQEGVKELRLTSQDMGAYGIDLGTSLKSLLAQIADMDLKLKVRVGMMNPKHLLEQMDVVDLMRENDAFYKFYHIPAQSGSDAVLKRMRRGNTVDEYLDVVKAIRKDKLAYIMNDMIVGFPGESEHEYEESVALCNKVRPDTTNVSKYSARPGTPAAEMEQLPRQKVNMRSKSMSELCFAISRERNEAWVGKTCDVTILEKVKTMAGRNSHYKQVVFDEKGLKIGDTVKAKLISAGIAYVKGKVVKK